MERFNSIYPFTTENIAGYMNDLDLSSKKVITVTGSSDHIINIALKGAKEVTTFDVNPLTEHYMELKLSAIKELTYKEFLKVFLYNTNKTLDIDIISKLKMNEDSKQFWIEQLMQYNNSGLSLRNSKLFNTKYFNPKSKLWQNLYLNKENYGIVQRKLEDVKIKFLNKSLKDLVLDEYYDYMFLSNISDYIDMMYESDGLSNYKDLINRFLTNVNQIYFAYLYDIENESPRSDIDNLSLVKDIFKEVEIEKFRSALENSEDKKDGVLILRRKENVRK